MPATFQAFLISQLDGNVWSFPSFNPRHRPRDTTHRRAYAGVEKHAETESTHCQSLCCRANLVTQPIQYFTYRLLAKSNNYFKHNRHKSRHYVNRFPSSTDHYHTFEIHDCLWGTALQVGRSRVRFPMGSLGFSLVYPSGCNMTLGSTQSVTDVNTMDISCGGSNSGRCLGSHNLATFICPTSNFREPQPPGTLRAYASLYRDLPFTGACMNLMVTPFSRFFLLALCSFFLRR